MSTLNLSFDSLTVPAGTVTNPGTVKSPKGGQFFYLRSTTNPLQIAFDSGNLFQIEGGFKVTEKFDTVTFYNPTDNPIVVVFYIGTAGIDYVGTNDVKNAATYSLGNANQAAGFIDANGFIALSKANFPNGITLIGVNKGNQRFQIVFSVFVSSANNLNILDAAGNAFLFMARGSAPITFQTNATFILKSDSWDLGGVCTMKIGELFYKT